MKHTKVYPWSSLCFLRFPIILHCSPGPSRAAWLFVCIFWCKGNQIFLRKKCLARVTRHTKENKRRQHKKCFIINILFKLRCYCCQNCNFHNEFQVLSLRSESQGPSKLPFTMTTLVVWKTSFNIFCGKKLVCFLTVAGLKLALWSQKSFWGSNSFQTFLKYIFCFVKSAKIEVSFSFKIISHASELPKNLKTWKNQKSFWRHNFNDNWPYHSQNIPCDNKCVMKFNVFKSAITVRLLCRPFVVDTSLQRRTKKRVCQFSSLYISSTFHQLVKKSY